jgi:hypothetical protein
VYAVESYVAYLVMPKDRRTARRQHRPKYGTHRVPADCAVPAGKSATGRSSRWGNVAGDNPVRNNENAGSGFFLLPVDHPRVSGMILDIHSMAKYLGCVTAKVLVFIETLFAAQVPCFLLAVLGIRSMVMVRTGADIPQCLQERMEPQCINSNTSVLERHCSSGQTYEA